MAIKSDPSADNSSLTLTLTNGELTALRDIMARWRFKDEKSLIEFALALLVTPDLIIAKREGEQMVNIQPADSLLTPPPSKTLPSNVSEEPAK